MKYLNHDLLSRLGNLPLEARHSMTGNVSGRHRSANRGSSVEFAEYRKYVSGDDTRRLDWKAYARSDRYYIKEFEADTNLRAYIVLDLSGSMNYHPEQVESKYLRACRLAANLAYIAIRQGDAVGLSFSRQTKDGATLHIPASRRPAHLNVLISQMDTQYPKGETVLAETLHELAERVSRRALVLIFSDLFTDTEELKNALRHLHFRKHDVAVFHLVDQLEIDFDFDRPIRFVDMEGGGSLITEPDLIADEYRAIVAGYLEEACVQHDLRFRRAWRRGQGRAFHQGRRGRPRDLMAAGRVVIPHRPLRDRDRAGRAGRLRKDHILPFPLPGGGDARLPCPRRGRGGEPRGMGGSLHLRGQARTAAGDGGAGRGRDYRTLGRDGQSRCRWC